MSVGIRYTGADGRSESFMVDSPSEAMSRLKRISGYVNKDADRMTSSFAAGLRERRKQRAERFATERQANAMNPSSSRAGDGQSTIIPGFGGLIVENGSVVGVKTFEMKFSGGQLIGTGGMREEHFKTRSSEEIRNEYIGWWGEWWRTHWRDYAYWMK